MTPLTTHPLEDKYYPALATIFNEIYPDYPKLTAERLKISESRFPKHLFREFIIVKQAGEIVAASVLSQDPMFLRPGWYFFNIWVRPQFQKQGIATNLFDRTIEKLSALQPKLLFCNASEELQHSIRFLEKRNFVEEHRNFESRIELSQFQPSAYTAIEQKLQSAGISFHNLNDLKDPQHRQRIYDLQALLERELPGSDLRPAMSYSDFWTNADQNMPDGEFFCVAMKNGEYIGLHFGSCPPSSDWFLVRITGVLPEYRKLGVATALKARGMAYAKQKGYPIANTWNDSRNHAMLTLNEKFGFQRQPASILFSRKF